MAMALFDSSNHAISLCDRMENQGTVVEIVQTPCRIARSGCSLCILFRMSFCRKLIEEGKKNGTPVREIYRIIKTDGRDKYDKVDRT
jgi:hypothetical protein